MRREAGGTTATQRGRRGFRFVNHPWLSMVTFLFLSVLVLGLVGTFASLVLGLPSGARTLGFINSLASHIVIL